MNSHAKFARSIAIAVSGVWVLALAYSGLHLNTYFQKGIGYLPPVLGLLVVAFDLWIWKWPGISKLHGRPLLYGTWKVVITPDRQSQIPEGGNWGPITGAMVIEQTYWTIGIRQHTGESTSRSATATLTSVPDSRQDKTLYFTYTNTAQQRHSERSRAHSGSTRLDVHGAEPQTLDGIYWTDRLTAGDLALDLIDRRTDRSQREAIAAATTQGGDPH